MFKTLSFLAVLVAMVVMAGCSVDSHLPTAPEVPDLVEINLTFSRAALCPDVQASFADDDPVYLFGTLVRDSNGSISDKVYLGLLGELPDPITYHTEIPIGWERTVALLIGGVEVVEGIGILGEDLHHLTFYNQVVGTPTAQHFWLTFSLERPEDDQLAVYQDEDNLDLMQTVMFRYTGYSEEQPDWNNPASASVPLFLQASFTWGVEKAMIWNAGDLAWEYSIRLPVFDIDDNDSSWMVVYNKPSWERKTFGLYAVRGMIDTELHYLQFVDESWYVFRFGNGQNSVINGGDDNRLGHTK